MDEVQIKGLAEKIAAMISVGPKTTDLAMIEKSIDSLNARLNKLELTTADAGPALQNPTTAHPSHERFNIAEAIADSIFDKYAKEKACTFEPNDKPCDHCSMCSSRGF